MLYVHGTVLGVEPKTTKDKKPYSIIHVLEGFEKNEVNSKGDDVNYGEGEIVEIPVRIFNDKLYEIKA